VIRKAEEVGYFRFCAIVALTEFVTEVGGFSQQPISKD
jgi:hypothetical protein